tara:strand:- start:791 stop:1771 length:981 start_codon:yes stop_codon:yes gene_type:complete
MEVIESNLVNTEELIERYPEYGSGEITWGSQLTVNDGEWGVFFRDGKALEVFESGRHVLTTQNIPVLTKFVTQFGYGPDSPFRSNVVFIAKKIFPNLKWGTPNPIIFRDPEINMIRLTAFGTLTIRVKDPLIFLNNLVGRYSAFSTKKIEDYLRSIVSSKLAEEIGSTDMSIFDLASKYSLISAKVKSSSFQEFENIGLELVDLLINAINPPRSVQEIMDKRSSMSIISDMQQFMQYQTATSIEDAANNESIAGLGVGAGAGFGLGMMVPQAMTNSIASGTSSSNGTNNEGSSLEDKLKTLNNLKENGLITEQEFLDKREKILSTL